MQGQFWRTCWSVIGTAALLAGAGCGPSETKEQAAAPATAATAAPAAQAAPAGAAPVCGLDHALTQCAPVQKSDLSSTVPADICDPHLQGWAPNQAGFNQLSWSTFVALNWPADPTQGRGVADKTKTIGATGVNGDPLPTVWDTYKQDYEVFRPNDPGWTLTDADWNKWGPAPPGCPSAPAGTPVLRMTAKSPPALARAVTRAAKSNGLLGDDVNEAFTGPLVDQAGNLVRYQIRMNQTEFDQIVDGNYYKPGADTSKLVFYDNTTDTKFGIGVTEVKAAWKVLSEAEWSGHTYYQRPVLVYNEADPQRHTPATCMLQKMGLVGLHIAHKTSFSDPDWVWATFEHVANVPPVSGAGKGPYSFNNPSCQPAVTPAQCAAAAKAGPNPSPQYQCCPNLQRYKAIGPPPDDPYNLQRGPSQATRLDPLTGATGCDAAYLAALQGTVWQNYFLVDTQWLNKGGEGSPGKAVITPATMRNTTLETYLAQWNGNQQVSTSSCIGCHSGGVDFSYIFPSTTVNAARLARHP
jgi:hypothetical protein